MTRQIKGSTIQMTCGAVTLTSKHAPSMPTAGTSGTEYIARRRAIRVQKLAVQMIIMTAASTLTAINRGTRYTAESRAVLVRSAMMHLTTPVINLGSTVASRGT